MYNTTAAENQANNESLYLSAGIHDNATLSNIRVDKSINNIYFIEFTFKKDSAEFKHTEWEPKRFPNQTESAYQSRQNRQLGRILQVLACYYTKDQLNINVDTFAELAAWVQSKLQDVLDGTVINVPVRLKIVFNKRGYKQLPDYCKYKFIEPMTTNPSNITKLDFDVFEKPIVADDEVPVKEDTKVDTTSGENADKADASDVPF
jgi:hypothetical protein